MKQQSIGKVAQIARRSLYQKVVRLFSIAVTEAHANIAATVADLPTVTPITRRIVEEEGASGRVSVIEADILKDADFYKDAFELDEVGKIDSDLVEGYFLTDGYINLAILKFKNEAVAGIEFGTSYTGIHHIGFEVDDLAKSTEKLQGLDSFPRDDPDGVMIDISETGWVVTDAD